MADMESEWLTYQQAAERLGCSPEAVRQKAIRGRWQKTIGNDKRPLIRFPDGWTNAVRTAVERKNSKHERSVRTADERASDAQLVKALEAHVETLKQQLAAAEARIAKQAEDLVAYDAAYAAGLKAEMAKVEAERARADKAIAAFASLADKLNALADRPRPWPWWRRLGLG
jgi:hypothetical protein